MPAATTMDPNPLGAEAARALEAIGDPVIVAARSGAVAYANDPARSLLPFPQDDPSRIRLTGKITTAFLAQASATRTPLAGVIALGREEEHQFRCHGCRMDREDADPLVVLRVLSTQDTRFSLLANEAVMLRRELAERERYQRRLHMLLCERDLFCATPPARAPAPSATGTRSSPSSTGRIRRNGSAWAGSFTTKQASSSHGSS